MKEYKKYYLIKIGAILLNKGVPESDIDVEGMRKMTIAQLKEKLKRLER